MVFSLKNGTSHPINEKNLGPGAYNSNMSTLKTILGRIGTQTRKTVDSVDDTPGPDRYEDKKIQFLKNRPYYTIGKQIRHDLSNKNKVPGPATYKCDDSILYKKDMQTIIGKGNRFKPNGNNPNNFNVGPGQYNWEKKKKHEGLMGHCRSAYIF